MNQNSSFNNALELLYSFIQIPDKIRAKFQSHNIFNIYFQQKDLNSDDNRLFHFSIFANSKKEFQNTKLCEISSNTKSIIPSPSGQYQLISRIVKIDQKKKKHVFDIFSSDSWCSTISVESISDNVYYTYPFLSIKWSNSENIFIYSGEHSLSQFEKSMWEPKETPFQTDLDSKEIKDTTEMTCMKPALNRELLDNWGEQLCKSFHPSLFYYDLKKKKHITISTPLNISCGQAVFSPLDQNIIFTGYLEEKNRMGLSFCNTRPSYLYIYNFLSHESSKLSFNDSLDDNLSHPFFNPSGEYLLFIGVPPIHAHFSASKLYIVKWCKENDQPVVNSLRCLIDIPSSLKYDDFPGLFLNHEPPFRCFLDSNRFLFHTQWHCTSSVILIDIFKGFIKRLLVPPNIITEILHFGYSIDQLHHFSLNLLDTYPFHSLVLITISSLIVPPMLCLVNFSDSDEKWTLIHPCTSKKCSYIEQIPSLHSFQFQVFTEFNENIQRHIESILVSPPQPLGLIVLLHGGPHSAYSTEFKYFVPYLASTGFSMLLINYRGSLGYGQNSLLSLIGNLCSIEVDDILFMIEKARYHLSKDRHSHLPLFLMGGSYGGYLTTYFISKYPHLFNAAATRNPVTNLLTMFSLTDIPDWVSWENNEPFSFNDAFNLKKIEKFLSLSPVTMVHNLICPLLLGLGGKDLRVPMSQGLEYVRLLKEKHIEHRCLIFENGSHSLLDSNRIEGDWWLSVHDWFKQHLHS